MPTENRAYGLLREIVERHHGTMAYQREGKPPHGAWIITLNGKVWEIPARGEHRFPELDQLYVPKPGIENPRYWDDYHHELIEGAEEQLLALHTKHAKGS